MKFLDLNINKQEKAAIQFWTDNTGSRALPVWEALREINPELNYNEKTKLWSMSEQDYDKFKQSITKMK